MLSSASKLPHLSAGFKRPFWAWSAPPEPVRFGGDFTLTTVRPRRHPALP